VLKLKLSDAQEGARVAALRAYEHPIPGIGELARSTDCLPVYHDWTAFLGLGRGGACLWVDYDDARGKIEAVDDLVHLSILVSHAARVKGLEALLPSRPPARLDCDQCSGRGTIKVKDLELGCLCGGLGWRPAAPAELGIEAA
jgi:hypothetical protein